RRMREGDFAKAGKRGPTVLDRETADLKLQLERVKRDYDTMEFHDRAFKDWNEKNILQKGVAYGAAGTRAMILSGAKVVGKIGSALAQRTVQQYPEEVFGRFWSRVFPRTAEEAGRFGGRMGAASEKAFVGGFARGVKEIPEVLKTGETELTKRHGAL